MAPDEEDLLHDLAEMRDTSHLPDGLGGARLDGAGSGAADAEASEGSDCEGQDAVQEELRAIHAMERQQAAEAASFGVDAVDEGKGDDADSAGAAVADASVRPGPFPGSDAHPYAKYDEYIYDPDPSGRRDVLNDDNDKIGQLQPISQSDEYYRVAVRCKRHKDCSRQRSWRFSTKGAVELPCHCDRILVKWLLDGQPGHITKEDHTKMDRE